MNSRQEELVNLLIARSMGSPFIFKPDQYRKDRRGTREPADLVWAGNGCAILFYMTKAESGRRDASWQIDHNLRQAKGWLRAWGPARKLIGRNAHRVFNIARGDYPHIVVVSVVHTPDGGPLQYHQDACKEFGISRCVTISETGFRLLAALGATMFDVIQVVERLRRHGDVESHQVVDLIASYEAYAHSVAAPFLDATRVYSTEFDEARRTLYGLRGKTQSESLEMFNDFSLGEQLALINLCARLMLDVRTHAAQGLKVKVVHPVSIDGIDIAFRLATTLPLLTEALAMAPPLNRERGESGTLDIMLGGIPELSPSPAELVFSVMSVSTQRMKLSRTENTLSAA